MSNSNQYIASNIPPTKLYQKIGIDHLVEIQEAILSKYRDEFEKHPDFFSFTMPWSEENFPVLHQVISTIMRRPIRLARFFITPPSMSQRIHVDGRKITPNKFALNIPIYAKDSNSFQIWYTTNSVGVDNSNSMLTDYITYAESAVSEISRVCVDVPMFVQTGICHRAVNFTSGNRIMLSLRFEECVSDDPLDFVHNNMVRIYD